MPHTRQGLALWTILIRNELLFHTAIGYQVLHLPKNNMKANSLLLLLLLPLAVFAQNNKLKSGISALKSGEYADAISRFDGIIVQSSKPEERAEAHYYRAESYVKLYQEALHNRNLQQLRAYSDAYVRASEDYARAAELDKSAWQESAGKELLKLYPELVRDGLQKLEDAKKEKAPEQSSPLLRNAAQLLGVAAAQQPQQYLPADLLGQIAMEQQQYRQAEQYLRQAAVLFNQYPPENPDLLAAYIYYRLALLEYSYKYKGAGPPHTDQLRTALEYLRQAKSLLESEYRRAGRMAGKLKPQELERYQRQHRSVQQDFYYLELDLYLQLPELHHEAIGRFKEALRKEPDSYPLTMGYARLLEKNDLQQALAMYQKAAMLQPESFAANYHIGIIYVNEAARFEKEAKQTANIDRYQQLNALSREYLAKARPYLQTAYRSDPDNLDLVNALLQVTLNLHLPDDYRLYKRKQMELGEK